MKLSNYVTQPDDKTKCSVCGRGVTLLCHKTNARLPWFYICWSCKHIAQLGVGPVEDIP